VVVGPRQSGKTTLVKQVFERHTYLNLENPELLAFANQDPQKLLASYENPHGIIIDEFQHAPQFLSYIQLEVDTKKRPGYFVLTGSQNFLMNQAITQSLAGRTGILTLLPLSTHELNQVEPASANVDAILFQGFYPRLYAEKFTPDELYPSYIRSYIERDVRQLINVENLLTFQKFMRLCAGRVGQLLNIEDLATNCAIDRRTAQKWLSVLEASYIIFLLKPHHTNFNKRLTKSPKLFFYDTGIACSMLSIRSAQDLALSSFRGHLFENMIIADLHKQYFNLGIEPPLYFWRDQNGRMEVDCIVDLGIKLIAIEIKSGHTINTEFFEPLKRWQELSGSSPEQDYIIYAGDQKQMRSVGHIIGWQQSATIIKDLEKKS
jgi:predicted AAA+ superfamily ATPase